MRPSHLKPEIKEETLSVFNDRIMGVSMQPIIFNFGCKL